MNRRYLATATLRPRPSRGRTTIQIKPIRALSSPVITVARPRVLVRPHHRRTRVDRVLVNVSNESQQVPVLLDQERFVPALEQTPDAPVPAVEALRVGRPQSQHHSRQRRRASLDRHSEHGCPSDRTPAAETRTAHGPSRTVQVRLPIGVISKHRPPLVAPGDDVVNRSLPLQPKRPRHQRQIIHRYTIDPVSRSTKVAESRHSIRCPLGVEFRRFQRRDDVLACIIVRGLEFAFAGRERLFHALSINLEGPGFYSLFWAFWSRENDPCKDPHRRDHGLQVA